MSKEDIADLVRSALISVAPEVESQTLDPDANFRDQMDLDSMDFLNFVVALHEANGVDVAEKDYPPARQSERVHGVPGGTPRGALIGFLERQCWRCRLDLGQCAEFVARF
jgi:acyl carrier protein